MALKEILSITTRINNSLDRLGPDLRALSVTSRAFLNEECSILSDGTVRIFHRPNLGRENFAIVLFPPAEYVWLTRTENDYIPNQYRSILAKVNGLFVFDFRLFGLAPTMQSDTPRLDRSKLQCLDLSLANNDWIREFKLTDKSFYFGGRAISFTENVGYFMLADSRIQSVRKTGEVLNEWATFSAFLSDELESAMALARSDSA